jgi:hypothetical protein
MATVQEDILSAFYAKLAKCPSVDQAAIDALRTALTSGKKLKSEDFAAILVKEPAGAKP